MHKKGQITLFVILGILILIGATIIISMNSKEENLLKKTITKSVQQSEQQMFEKYVRDCIDRQIYYNLQHMFANLFSTIYIQNGVAIGVIEDKPIMATKIVDETIQVYEEKLNLILQHSQCLQNIPEQYAHSSVNAQNTELKIIAEDSFIVETSIDGKTEKDGEITTIPLLKKSYGNIYKSDFQKTINAYVIVSLLCEQTICFPQITYLLSPEMNTTLSNRGLGHTNLIVTREKAIVADKKIKFNIELIKK